MVLMMYCSCVHATCYNERFKGAILVSNISGDRYSQQHSKRHLRHLDVAPPVADSADTYIE